MKAKSNQPFPVQAFGGLRITPGEWVEVPSGLEDEARRNQYLILDEGKTEPEAKPESKDEPEVKTPVSPSKPAAKKAAKK